MSYRAEFGAHWQPLLAATVGMAVGLSLNHYVMSLFAPELIAEFGWSKAQFALIGATPFISLFLIPLAGQFTDRVGPRTAALVGFISLPIGYLALSLMTGSFVVFFAIMVVHSVLGTLTTTMVFARVIVERFRIARGFALSIVMSGGPVFGAICVPLIAGAIDDHGWRATYRLMGLISLVGGAVTWALLGSTSKAPRKAGHMSISLGRLRTLFRSPVFLCMTGGMLLVNLPQVLAASQLKLVLQDSGADNELTTLCIALYAAGVAFGRFLSGLALDRVAVHKVALFVLGIPAFGLIGLASPFDGAWFVAACVLLMALAQGAEGDIGAYLVAHKFAIGNYSLILSLVTCALTLGAACGSVVLSATLGATDSYVTFLYVCAGATWLGALLFFLTGRYPAEEEAHAA